MRGTPEVTGNHTLYRQFAYLRPRCKLFNAWHASNDWQPRHGCIVCSMMQPHHGIKRKYTLYIYNIYIYSEWMG